jgi:acetyl-CoA carboxylase biotin carboxyl carrier protein
VASGPNAALPHARPGERTITEGDLVVLDFGGVYDSYCVDLTRTVSVGPASSRAREVHAAVREARDRAIACVAPGRSRFAIDAAARDTLAGLGLGEAFGHGTGHGLGIEVHEDLVSPDVAARWTQTTKPSRPAWSSRSARAYYAGFGGVRIEDDVAVTATGVELHRRHNGVARDDDLDQLKQILSLVHEYELAELEIEHDGLRVWVRTSTGPAVAAPLQVPASAGTAAALPALPSAPPGLAQDAAPEGADTEIELAIVKSPIVGTFYRSTEPGAPSFVEVGSSVKKGQVLCIIEAMKLMNEIDSMRRRGGEHLRRERATGSMRRAHVRHQDDVMFKEDPDRQPRRSGVADHLRLPGARHQDRRLYSEADENSLRALCRRGRAHRWRAAPTAT